MFTPSEHYLSVSVAVYVTVCLVVAILRWRHKCEPYASHIDYYYPGWRTVVFSFLSIVNLIPVIFMPGDTDSVLLLRMVLLLSSPFLCAVLIFSYFGKVLKVKWWRKPIIALSFTYVVMTGTALVLAIVPGTQLQGTFLKGFFFLGGTLALIYLVCFIQALRMILKVIRRFSDENYSNPDDFPKQYAESVLIIAVLHLVMSWSTTINGAPWALTFGLIVLSVLSVFFLIGILSPHRAVEVAQLETEVLAPREEVTTLPRERVEEMLQRIREQVEGKETFLDSHLSLMGLSQNCGINRTYLSNILSEYEGGFFAYINRCRLTYADNYRAEHPQADVDEIALNSGFNSRQSYYNAKKRLAK
jgi:AraC-like DNA-binding protein